MREEYILCAAIYVDDGEYHSGQEQNGTGRVYAGYRHHYIFSLISREDKLKYKPKQGFLISKGRFIDRREAADIARKSGQAELSYSSDILYSEDLY